jgi:low affinity Fe/Cu permease
MVNRKPRRPRKAADTPSTASRLIDFVTEALGHPTAVALAAALVVLWLGFGPLFHFSDTYQLVINTTTTIITFVMVFAIQHTTNRETRAINLKLDDLLEALDGANDMLVGVETKSEATIKKLQKREAERAGNHNGSGRGRAAGRATTGSTSSTSSRSSSRPPRHAA